MLIKWLNGIGKREYIDLFQQQDNKFVCDRLVNLSGLELTEVPDIFDNVVINVLNLANNKIKELPSSFSKIKCRNLTLSNNNFIEFPKVLCKNKTGFNALLFDYNQIKTVPKEIEELKSNVLRLDHNQISSLPRNFSNLVADVVILNNNNIDLKNIPYEIEDPKYIEEILW